MSLVKADIGTTLGYVIIVSDNIFIYAADSENYHKETYGPQSKCLEHSQRWTRIGGSNRAKATQIGGAGCYHVGTRHLKTQAHDNCT